MFCRHEVFDIHASPSLRIAPDGRVEGRRRSAARAFASEIRRGKKIRINKIGRFEARVVEDTVVEARRITEKATA